MQNRSYFLLSAIALLVACGPRQQAVAPATDHGARPAIIQQNVNAALYQNASAEVAWLFEQGYAFARVKLDANLAATDSLPPAVVVDVDETVLDNSAYEVENIVMGRGYADSTWKAWTARAAAPPIPGAVDFLKYAAGRGCTVFYITNRHHSEKESTITNLRKYDFPMADAEHVLTMGESSDKTERRSSVQRSHRVVLFVGDQLTDYSQLLKDRSLELGLPGMYMMAEPLSRYFILLPNSVYGYWRDGITGRGTDAEKMRRVDDLLRQRIPK